MKNKIIIKCIAFILTNGDTFLTEKRKLTKRTDPGKIAIPSGGVNKDETSEQALQREIMEELSIEATEYNYLCTLPYLNKEVDFSIDYYVVTKWKGEITNTEAEKLLWANRRNPKLDIWTDKEAIRTLNLREKNVKFYK